MLRYAPLLLALTVSQPALALANGSSSAGTPKPSTIVAHSPNRCILTGSAADDRGSGFFATVAAIVAPALFNIAVDGIVADLNKVRTVKSAGEAELYLFHVPRASGAQTQLRRPVSQMPKCLTLVTGAFSGSYNGPNPAAEDPGEQVSFNDRDPQATDLGVISRSITHDDLRARLVKQKVIKSSDSQAQIYSVLEVRVVESEDKTAFRFVPQYMNVFELMPGNRRKKQGLVYNISLAGPGASPDGSTYALAPVSFGTVSKDFSAPNDDKLAKKQTGWLSRPGMSDAAKRAHWTNLAADDYVGKIYMPAKIKAQVVQTQKPSGAEKFLAKLLGGIKEGAAGKIGGAFKEADSFADGQALLNAKAAVCDAETAYATAQNGSDTFAEESARLKLEVARNALGQLQDDTGC